MDNVTHALIGVALGKSFFRKARDPKIQRAALLTAVIGNNLPDLDFLIVGAAGGSKLAYLLHHRGHTHTALFAIPGAFIAAWLGAKLARLPAGAWKRFLPLGLLSCLLHLFADFANNYGVHPFYPFNSRWFYGDTLFIVEPMIWLSMLPLPFMRLRSWIARLAFFCIYLGMIALVWNGPFVPAYVCYALSLWAALFFLAQMVNRGPAPAWIGLAATVAIFAGASLVAKRVIAVDQKKLAPFEVLKDIALTPAPSNPLCWNALVVTQILDERYVVRTAGFSFAPEIADPETCFFRDSGEKTAPLKRTTLTLSKKTEKLIWLADFRGTISEAVALKEKYCGFDQLLRYSRVPFWNVGEKIALAGDLRYDFEPELGFAEIELKQDDTDCVGWVPGWQPPRRFDPPIKDISDVTR